MIRSFLDGMNLKSRSQRKCSRRWHDRLHGGLECLEGRVLLSGNPTIYTVNLTTDAGTTSAGSGSGTAGDLRFVINQANADPNTDGTLIEFDPTVFSTAQTIILSPTLGTLTLSNPAGPEMIDGPGADLATVSGNNAVAVLSVASGVNASISGLSINAGRTPGNGGGIDNNGLLTLTSDIFSGNSATGSGGGIDNEASGTLTVAQSTFSNNTAAGNGGGIDNSGSLTLMSDTFDTNVSTGSGGGGVDNETTGTLTDTGSAFTNNTAGADGGGIKNGLGAQATITGDTFASNAAAGSGGAIENTGTLTLTTNTLSVNTATGNGGGIENSGSLTLTSDTLSNNTATGSGGAIDNETRGTVIDTQSTFAKNMAVIAGGGIENSGGLTLTSDTFDSNVSTGPGGGIDNQTGAVLTITSATITSNSASSGGGLSSDGGTTITSTTITNNSATNGGGIANDSGAVLTITGATIASNSASNGGGIFNAGTATLTNSTVAANSASLEGGGMVDQGPAALTLIACTVSGNSAAAGGGLYNISPGGIATLTDPIIAGNVEPGGASDDINGNDAGDVTGSFNLIGTGGSGGIIDGQNNNIVLASLATLNLAPLGDYGGPTETIALLSGSPAIGAGVAVTGVTTDQRGFPLSNPVDIGSYQAQSNGLVVNTTVDAVGLPAGVLSLRQAINLANTLSGGASITFDPTVFGSAQTITLTEGTLVLSNMQTPETIVGPTGSSLTINGNNTAGVFLINSGVTASLTDLTISGGSAVSGGGIDNNGSLALSNSTVANNTGASGGGISSTGSLTIVNSTIVGNTATSNGGGGFFDGGTVTVVNSTITDNVVPGGSSAGAGLSLNGGTDILNNTIVALNTDVFPNGTTADDIAGTPLATSSGFNLIGTGGAGGLVNGTNGNLVNVANPRLGLLANNGGPTATVALLLGSPAIDAGSNALAVDPNTGVPLAFDQRGSGFPRIVNSFVDIGAYELSGSVSTPTVYTVNLTSASGAGVGTAGDLAFVIGQADANSNPAGSVINFDPTVFATKQTIVLSGTLMLSPPAGPIVINGPQAGVIISGNALVEVFEVARNVTATLTGLTISDGLVAGSGGAIHDNLAANLTLTNDVFTNNSAAFFGGAIYNDGGTLAITNTTFSNNSATYGLGGAIDNTGALTVIGSTFTGGNAFQGGAIDNRSGTLAVTNSTFTFNIAIMGGAIFNDAVATVLGSTIANNMAVPSSSGSTTTVFASFDGGAIANDHAGVLTIINSTLAFNAAGQAGGAIDTVGVLTATNDTIAFNTVAPGGSGGGIYASTGTTNLSNTIVDLNTSGSGTTATSSDISGNVAVTSAFNLIGTGGAGGLTGATNGNLVGVTAPGLATTLANNGGSTLTLALLAGSPAIDAGNNALAVNGNGNALLFDQRGQGFPRIVNSIVDIGAFERSLATTTFVTSSLNPSVVGNTVTFTITVSPAKANPNSPTGTVTLFSGTIALATLPLFNGTATFTTSNLPFGVSVISAVYSGDLIFATSTSTSLNQTVNAPSATPLAETGNQPSVLQSPIASSAPAPVASAVKPAASLSMVTIAAAPHGHVVKKAVAPKKAHPKGGASTKFHQPKHTAVLKRSVAAITKHAKVKVKKK
jgi:fibronectin-binding autotransporter adhesin